MKSKDGVHPSYNAQAAVDADSRMVVGAAVSQAGSDHGELKGVLSKIEEIAGRNPEQLSADAGYRATEGLVELEKRGIHGVVALQESTTKTFRPEDFLYLEEAEGKALLEQRAQTVELVFGWLKQHKGFRQFYVRGLEAVQSLWNFELAALNVERLIKRRQL